MCLDPDGGEVSTKRIIRDIGIVTMLLAGRSIVGFIREVVMASYFGRGFVMDAFGIASRIPITIANLLVVGVFSAVFLPIFTRYIVEGRKEELNRLVGVLFIIITIGFTVLVILGEVFAKPFITTFLANPKTAPETVEEAVVLFRLMLPAVLLMAWAGLAQGVHNSFQRFTMPAFGNLLFNLWMVLPMWIFPASWGIRGIAIGVLIGAVFQLGIQLPGLFGKNLKLEINFNMHHPALIGIGSLILPVLLGSGTAYIVPIFERYLASGIPGAVAALDKAFQVSQLPLSIFVLAISTIVYPMFAEAVARNRPEALKYNILWGLRLVTIVIIPAGFGLLALAHPIVMMLFQRGEWKFIDTMVTAGPLAFYGVALLPWALTAVLIKVFYSLGDTKTPVWIALVTLSTNVILDILLLRFRVVGLSVGATCAAFLGLFLQILMVRKKIGIFGMTSLLTSVVKSTIASVAMGFTAYFIAIRANYVFNLGTNFARSVQVGFAIVAGILVYFIVLYIIDRKEINEILTVLRRRGQPS